MSVFLNLVTVVLRVILPAVFSHKPDTMENAASQNAVRNRLRKKIRATWKTPVVLILIAAATCPLGGCWFRQVRTVYIEDGQPVRLRETIKSAKVWVPGKDGTPVAGVVDLPEGWYCLSLSEEPESASGTIPQSISPPESALPALPEPPDLPVNQTGYFAVK